jgi:hypothetical protein
VQTARPRRCWKEDFETGTVIKLKTRDDSKRNKIIFTSSHSIERVTCSFPIIHKPNLVSDPPITKPQISYRMHVPLNKIRVRRMTVICSLTDSPSPLFPPTHVTLLLCNFRPLKEEKFNLPPSRFAHFITNLPHTNSLHSHEERLLIKTQYPPTGLLEERV